MTPMTSQPVCPPATRPSRLNQMMQTWRARSPAQRFTLSLAACLTVLALGLDAGVVAVGRHLVREIIQAGPSLSMLVTPSIQPLQGVPGNKIWLIVHVSTMVSAFAAFTLAWALGIVNLAVLLAWPRRTGWMRTLSGLCYRTMQGGVVLLAVGMVLSACWAAQSWGRFWNWDSKEVWALMALICYLSAIQARHAGWVKDFGLTVCAVLCFGSIIMAWYGVNFILKTGLHSYGFGSANNLQVYWLGLANGALVVHATARYLANNAAMGERRDAGTVGTSLTS